MQNFLVLFFNYLVQKNLNTRRNFFLFMKRDKPYFGAGQFSFFPDCKNLTTAGAAFCCPYFIAKVKDELRSTPSK